MPEPQRSQNLERMGDDLERWIPHLLVGIGCVRLVARVTREKEEEDKTWPATVAAFAVALSIGPFGNLLYRLASRAAAGLF